MITIEIIPFWKESKSVTEYRVFGICFFRKVKHPPENKDI